MASYHLLPPDTHVFIPAGRLIFGRAGFLPAESHQLTLAHALFFQTAPAGETYGFNVFNSSFTNNPFHKPQISLITRKKRKNRKSQSLLSPFF